MAKAITHIRRMEISEEEQRRLDLEEVEAMLIEHKDALRAFLTVLDKMNKQGGFDIAAGLFDEGEHVIDILVKAIDNPGAARTLKNGLLLIGTLGQLNVEKLGPVIARLNGGLDEATEWSEGDRSVLQLLGQTNWKEALLFLVSFFKGLGQEKEEPRPRKGTKRWVTAAGLSVAGFLLLRKKVQ